MENSSGPKRLQTIFLKSFKLSPGKDVWLFDNLTEMLLLSRFGLQATAEETVGCFFPNMTCGREPQANVPS